MRYIKILVVIAIALAVLLLSLLILGRARADTPVTNSSQQRFDSPASDLVTRHRRPVTVNLWLMPDFEEKKVWVDGIVSTSHPFGARDLASDSYHLTALLPFSSVVTWIDSPWVGYHHFGWWEGSQITPSRQLTGAYEVHLPGLDLQPEDALNIRLVSGIVLTDTLVPQTITTAIQTITPTNLVSAVTGTLGIALDFTPTAAVGTTPTVALTGSYTLTGLELSPANGQFVITPHVALTTDYTLPRTSLSPTTRIVTQTIASPPFSYTLDVRGDYSQLSLRNFSQPTTLTLSFYQFEKAIDLTLTPLLVETVMTQTASAIGGNAFRKLHGAEYRGDSILYAQGGLLGRGEINLHIHTLKDDPQRSATALITDFRQGYQQENLNRLLERCLDFPSFPVGYKVGQLNAHKETILEVVTTEISGTARSDAPALTLKAPFRLNVWRAHDLPPRRETLVFTPTATSASNLTRGKQLYSNALCDEENPDFDYASDIYEFYDFPDFHRCIGGQGDKQVLQMGLGRIILGPHDILTLTIESAAWVSLDPLPDVLEDHWQQGLNGPERSGFTAVYRGPRSFWLDIRYTPHPSLFVRQSMLMIRGFSRTFEDRLGKLWTDRVRKPVRRKRLFSVGLESIDELDAGQMPEWLFQEFESHTSLSGTVGIRTLEIGKRWRIYDSSKRYLVVKENQSLRVYREYDNVAKEGRVSIVYSSVFFLIMWGLYQWITPEQGEERRNKNKRKQDKQGRKKGLVVKVREWRVTQWFSGRLREVRTSQSVHILLRFCPMLLFLILGLMLENSFVGGGIAKGSRPFAIAVVCGALLLLRFWKALLLFVVGVIGFAIDMLLAGQYTDKVQDALVFSSASGMLSGATSVAMLIITLAWLGMLFWWSRTKQPRFQLQHRDLHAFTFFGLAAAVFEVTDASLLALFVLYLAWLAFSLILDAAKPLEPKFREKQSKPNAQDSPKSPSSGRVDTKGPNPNSAQLSTEVSKTSPQPGQQTQDTTDAESAEKDSDNGEAELVETLDNKLKRFLKPLPIGVILVAAILLSRDPLLRLQLASFAQSASPQNAWFVILDPLARLATTLVPCLAIVLLTVILDSSLEHWLLRKEPLGTYMKAIPLTFVLFSIFALGIGGLNLFTGTLGLKLSDRLVYYVTIPLVTSIWVDWDPEKGEGLLAVLKNNLDDVNKWISIILALLSILAPRIISPITSEQFNQIIKTLQTFLS